MIKIEPTKPEEVTMIKKCPKCGALALEYDKKNNRIHCLRCGFEQPIMV